MKIFPSFSNIMNCEQNGIVSRKLVRPARHCRTCFWPVTRESLPTLVLNAHCSKLFI